MFALDMIDTHEAAAILKSSRDYARQLIREGRFSEVRKVSGRYFVDSAEVRAFRHLRVAQAGLPPDYDGPLPMRKRGPHAGSKRSAVRRLLLERLRAGPASREDLLAATGANMALVGYYLREVGATWLPDGRWSLPQQEGGA